ncbi:UDPdiphospho-muramoylpentapeptide beta-N-acetylglucosaminyltransferase [Mycolicibacterium farcinogenes]|nr:UDPdiphospho-muramoylpentapeptide beta-N-acetylglucosaminyltransferase [Mycolicibacterium farcinogenes]
MVSAGGGIVVDDAELTGKFVADTVANLMTDDARLAAMTSAASLSGHPDAARRVAQVALDIAREQRKRLQ